MGLGRSAPDAFSHFALTVREVQSDLRAGRRFIYGGVQGVTPGRLSVSEEYLSVSAEEYLFKSSLSEEMHCSGDVWIKEIKDSLIFKNGRG